MSDFEGVTKERRLGLFVVLSVVLSSMKYFYKNNFLVKLNVL